jgi:8-amino-7-oxononanoate synthase
MLILSDGFCPACGKPAPVSDYLSIAEICGGHLLLDDTQSLGIFGHSPNKANPYGLNGGGILQWSRNTNKPNVIVVSSMAKAFGVPVAVLSGSDKVIRRYKEKSKVRVHCSPPSNAVIHAARHALALNRRVGDRLRKHLSRLVCHLRKLMATAGFLMKGGICPVQTFPAQSTYDAVRLYEQLLRQGVKAVLHRGTTRKRALISFLINAVHNLGDIDYLVNALIALTKRRNLEVTYEIQT